ncbi:MAG: FISUMP domain-containing protein [Saprospiraceae bacterium]
MRIKIEYEYVISFRKLLFGLIFPISIISTSSGTTLNTIPASATELYGKEDSLLKDKEGNKYSIKIFSGNTIWMTSNLKLNIPGSYCYDNEQMHCNQYGRLYTWEAAQQGCAQLGVGWRLPSKIDWQLLISNFIDNPADTLANRKTAYKELILGGKSKFNALLGGGRNSEDTFKRVDEHGFYWTAGSIDKTQAWYYNFGKGSLALYLQNEGEKSMAISVRCVKYQDR